MNEHQKELLDQKLKLQRGAAIIDGIQDTFRQDGYSNMLNKYGTSQDNSIAYEYQPEAFSDDLELIRLYEGNGLFSKIIDRPSEEAVKHGLDIDYGDEDIAEYVADRLDELDFEDKFATAEKWARLYGGSIIVMLVDDGRGLEEPLDLANAKSIKELRVFERAIVQPDYTSMSNFHFIDSIDSNKPFGEPEYFQVFSIYGYFLVHRTRCLVFRNGRLPEQTTNANYRYWGIPEYVKIKRALRECITAHEDGVKLMERSVQAIYKMKNLANLLSTDDGENKVIQRLQLIDMARGILNSIAIDTDGEDYDFKNFSVSGVKDIVDSTCNMLSAVTNIPQTVLFGRSPAGMNSTGDSDLENYYNMTENIQKQNMKGNVRRLIDLILKQGYVEGEIREIPKYKVVFAPLWSSSETEQASIELTRAQIEQVKAATAQVYVDAGIIDANEVRNNLAKEGTIEIEELVPADGIDLPDDTFDFQSTPTGEVPNSDGGEGSGNWGHEGRPGKVGGSAEGGGIQNRTGTEETGFSSEAKKAAIEEASKITRSSEYQEWTNCDEYDRLAYIEVAKEDYPNYGISRNGTIANAIAANEGLDQRPTVMSEDEFDDFVEATGSTRIYRGVQDLEDDDGTILVSAKEIREGFSGSDDFIYGGGNYGSGYHFAREKSTAQGFAGSDGEVLECAIKPSAQIMDYSEWANLPESRKAQYDNDPGLYSLTNGYDGIDTGSYINIQNRAALVYKKPGGNEDSADAEHCLGSPTAIMPDGERYQAAAVIISQNGRILCAARANKEGICGPGGHIKPGEMPEDAAVREALEEFNILPLNLIPLGELQGSTGLYLTTKVYLTDQFTGTPKADGVEMMNERWILIDELHKEFLFPAFEKSIELLCDVMRPIAEEQRIARHSSLEEEPENISQKAENPLYNSGESATITMYGFTEDGGSGSGNFGHNGVPGKVGGSAPKSSAEGANEPCTGFASTAKLTQHFGKHGKQLGFTDKAEYQAAAINFLKQPCGGSVVGYSTAKGKVIRFNTETTEYASGFPGRSICTYMKAKCKKDGTPNVENATAYYKRVKKGDGC